VAAAKVKDEREKAADRIGKAGGKPPDHVPGPPPPVPLTIAQIKAGKGLKYKDRTGKDVIYKGKGKQSKEVKAYLAGELGAVQVTDFDPASGNEIFPKKTDSDGLPLFGTKEYDERMAFSEEFCRKNINTLSILYQKRYNNPLAPEEVESGVFACKWLVFKHADKLKDQPELMALGWLVGNHIQHARYISTKTGKLCTRDEWYIEQGMVPPKPGIMDRFQIGGGEPPPLDPDGGDEVFKDERKYADMASKQGDA
jgi:hypothetical protein